MSTSATSPVETRRTRQDKPTVQLRRPSCTELAGNPALIAQLVLATEA